LATLRLQPARMQLISGFIDTYLRLNVEEERLFQAELSKMGLVEQAQIMEIVTSWMEQGIQQGRQEGKQEGKQEEALLLILRLLTRRVGRLTPELQEHIRSLAIAQLEELGEALLDFSDVADLQAWLDSHLEA